MQFIDFGLSITEKSNDPYSTGGYPGFIHPDYTFLMTRRPFKWTQDWYAFGKHMFHIGVQKNISLELNKSLLPKNKNLKQFFKKNNIKTEIQKSFIVWIGELLFLEMLGFHVEEQDFKDIPVHFHYKQLFFSLEFFNVIQSIIQDTMKNFLSDKMIQAKKSLGEDGINLIKELCRWKYNESSALPLLKHAYFNNFSNLKETTQKRNIVKHISYSRLN